MMYAITCIDGPQGTELRKHLREKHLAHLDAHAAQMQLAGPLLDETGELPIGSLLIMDFDNLAAAEAFTAADPYQQGGVFESVTITRFKQSRPIPPAA